MANSNGWGDGAANNAIGWGQGAINPDTMWVKDLNIIEYKPKPTPSPF
jgi:hypothetical protein